MKEIWNRIKQFFKKDKVEAISESTTKAGAGVDNAPYIVTREDGTQLKIQRQLDKLGNQVYEQVFNTRTNQMQCIPKFQIYADELKDLIISQIMLCPVLIDMDPNLLDNQECLEWLANNMLNRERMPKVIQQYNGYAGILEVDSNSRDIIKW